MDAVGYALAQLIDPIKTSPAISYATNGAQYPTSTADQGNGTRLQDGRVLVTGGLVSNTEQTACYILDFVAGTRTTVASMPTGKARHAQATLNDGRVLVAGGIFNNTAFIYDPVSNTWTDKGAIGTSISGDYPGAATLTDGRVFVSEGNSGSPSSLYDPNTNVWSDTANNPVQFSSTPCISVGNNQVAIIGQGGSVGGSPDTAYIYDATANTFTLKSGVPFQAGTQGQTMLTDGRVATFSIQTSSGGSTAVYTWTVATNTWQSEPALPVAMDRPLASCLLDGRVAIYRWKDGAGTIKAATYVGRPAISIPMPGRASLLAYLAAK